MQDGALPVTFRSNADDPERRETFWIAPKSGQRTPLKFGLVKRLSPEQRTVGRILKDAEKYHEDATNDSKAGLGAEIVSDSPPALSVLGDAFRDVAAITTAVGAGLTLQNGFETLSQLNLAGNALNILCLYYALPLYKSLFDDIQKHGRDADEVRHLAALWERSNKDPRVLSRYGGLVTFVPEQNEEQQDDTVANDNADIKQRISDQDIEELPNKIKLKKPSKIKQLSSSAWNTITSVLPNTLEAVTTSLPNCIFGLARTTHTIASAASETSKKKTKAARKDIHENGLNFKNASQLAGFITANATQRTTASAIRILEPIDRAYHRDTGYFNEKLVNTVGKISTDLSVSILYNLDKFLSSPTLDERIKNSNLSPQLAVTLRLNLEPKFKLDQDWDDSKRLSKDHVKNHTPDIDSVDFSDPVELRELERSVKSVKADIDRELINLHKNREGTDKGSRILAIQAAGVAFALASPGYSDNLLSHAITFSLSLAPVFLTAQSYMRSKLTLSSQRAQSGYKQAQIIKAKRLIERYDQLNETLDKARKDPSDESTELIELIRNGAFRELATITEQIHELPPLTPDIYETLEALDDDGKIPPEILRKLSLVDEEGDEIPPNSPIEEITPDLAP